VGLIAAFLEVLVLVQQAAWVLDVFDSVVAIVVTVVVVLVVGIAVQEVVVVALV